MESGYSLWHIAAAFAVGAVASAYFNSQKTPTLQNPKTKPPTSDSDDVTRYNGEPRRYKMVFVVRMDLQMGKGKIAAQVGHATLGAYKRALKKTPEIVKEWDTVGGGKVVLKAKDEQELLQIEQKAKQAGLNTHLVIDAGRTQIAAGSCTVLAIGPDEFAKIDSVTGHLKLL